LGRRQIDTLDALSHRSAVAALLFLIQRSYIDDAEILLDVAELLKRQAPDHPLALAEIGRHFAQADAGTPALSLRPGIERFPNNYLYATAAAWNHQAAGDFAAAVRAAEHAVRCTPRSPAAWIMLGTIYQQQADSVRRGRFVADLSEEQWAYCRQLYQPWLACARRSCELDPHRKASWSNLSSAAAHAGDNALADRAFWKALELEREDPTVDDAELYAWGLELYQFRWQENPVKAGRVARLAAGVAAAAGDHWGSGDRVEIAGEMSLAGFPDLARKVVRTPEERASLAEHLNKMREVLRGRGTGGGGPSTPAARPADRT
jgi:tetratricopeptide (TPR) repeat protein